VAFATPAWAAKEKFVRNKPHVNIGTIGLKNESMTVSLGLVSVEDQVSGSSSSSDACGGMFDIRVVDADNPSGPSLSEVTGLRVTANGRTTFNHVGGETAEDVYLVIVARDMDNVSAKGCIVRGRVDIVDNADGSTRSLEVRAEDFIKTKTF
jgi:hypothetical protein